MERNNFQIRPETAADYDAIYELIRTAFETARVKEGTEQDFAVDLRNGAGYIPELALVAEQAGRLIGHIMFTRLAVESPGGKRHEMLLLAPVSVVLGYRDRGVGSALVREGCRRARELGYGAVCLVGDPAYYVRFGFRPGADYGIRLAGDIPAQYVQALELVPGALEGVTGTIECC